MKNTNVNQHIALLTKHGKESILEPIFLAAFGTKIKHTDSFDTDTLGTFDNVVARTLSPKETALKKAYLACDLTGCSQGLGSEGSFNSMFGLSTNNHEIIAFVDIDKKLELFGFASSPSKLNNIEAKSASDFVEQAKQIDKNQKWMIRQNEVWTKGLSIEQVVAQVENWPICIEPDCRAMHSPSRQEVIALACQDLVNRLKSTCPQCEAPDYVEKPSKKYLPCEICTLPTNQTVEAFKQCDKCGHNEFSRLPPEKVKAKASAFYCDFCNP